MPRILILHASVGAGHKSAATALAAAFARKQDGDVRVEDTLDYGSAVFRQTYGRAYIELSERMPLLWGMFYQNTDITAPELIELTNRLRGTAAHLALTRLERLIRQFAPAAIICTHFLPVELLLRLKGWPSPAAGLLRGHRLRGPFLLGAPRHRRLLCRDGDGARSADRAWRAAIDRPHQRDPGQP